MPKNLDSFSLLEKIEYFGEFVGCDSTGCYIFYSMRLFNEGLGRFASEVAPSLDPVQADIPIIGEECESSFGANALGAGIWPMLIEICTPIYDNNVWKGVISRNLQRTHAFGWYARQFPDQVQLIDPKPEKEK